MCTLKKSEFVGDVRPCLLWEVGVPISWDCSFFVYIPCGVFTGKKIPKHISMRFGISCGLFTGVDANHFAALVGIHALVGDGEGVGTGCGGGGTAGLVHGYAVDHAVDLAVEVSLMPDDIVDFRGGLDGGSALVAGLVDGANTLELRINAGALSGGGKDGGQEIRRLLPAVLLTDGHGGGQGGGGDHLAKDQRSPLHLTIIQEG